MVSSPGRDQHSDPKVQDFLLNTELTISYDSQLIPQHTTLSTFIFKDTKSVDAL